MALLQLLKAGYTLVAADSTQNLVYIPITDTLTMPLRAANSWDIAALNEILIEKDYGASFPGYRILDVGAYNGDTPLFFAAYGAEKVIAAEPAPDNYASPGKILPILLIASA